MSELLTIGQFSRMCWLSIKALRLHDEAGLLPPAYVDPVTGYRYYSPEQAATARAIAILRSLDMPLAEIKDVVTESDADRVRDLLDMHRQVLQERIDRHRHMLMRVEDFIRKGAVMAYDITTKYYEPVDVVALTLNTSPESISADAGPAYHRIYEAVQQAGSTPAAPPRLAYLAMADDAWIIEVSVPVEGVTQAPEGFTLRRFEGCRAATTTHVGPYDELGMVYREMEVWIGKQGLTPSGPPFDVYPNDPGVVKDPAKYETEVVWPIK